MWEIIIENRLYPTYIVELIAAISGVFYLIIKKPVNRADKLIVSCLSLIFIIDLTGIIYALYTMVYDYKYIEFLKDTPFRSVFWIYNVLTLISSSMFTLYFVMQLHYNKLKRLTVGLILIFILSSIIHFFSSDVFFNAFSAYVYIFGAFLICISIALYYLELVRTDRILNFRRELPLFISFGLLIYQLGITPLFIFQKYIKVSEDFSDVYGWTLDLGNIFMYLVFALGFIKMILEIKRTGQKAIS